MFALDGRGIPGVNILTEEFTDAFDVQRRAIGFDGAAIFVPHPMQNRTRAELEGFADRFCENVLSKICLAPPPTEKAPAA